MKKQNIVYLYANGKTESFDASFGYRAIELELAQTLKEMVYEKKQQNKPLPVTLLFVEEGKIIGSLVNHSI